MTVLSGDSLRYRAMIDPFCARSKSHGMTYGVGYAGYDIRVREAIDLPPGGFSLASTVEAFDMDNDVIGVVHDKSTWARRGLAVQNTVLEPGWVGYLTLELTNHNKGRRWWEFWKSRRTGYLYVHAGSPIAQVLFHYVDRAVENGYTGKYQHQMAGPQPAILEPDLDCN